MDAATVEMFGYLRTIVEGLVIGSLLNFLLTNKEDYLPTLVL